MPVFRRLRRPPAAISPDRSVLDFARGSAPDGPVLAVRGLAKNFGGIRALVGIDVAIRRGTVHGLIGPNGSGKSTFVNVVTGVFRPTAGTIVLGDEPLPPQGPHRMARHGITRTFQSIRLFGELSVIDNVMVGFHLQLTQGFLAHLLQTRAAVGEEAAFRRKAMALLEFVGIAERAHEPAQNLSYGQQRLLEIARALATRPQLLMLDEPAAGRQSDRAPSPRAHHPRHQGGRRHASRHRAPHGAHHGDFRRDLGARLRAEDRRGQRRRGAAQTRR